MRAREFITEGEVLATDVKRAMPSTYVLPDLKNQDMYLQYRFGVAMASARAAAAGEIEYTSDPTFGEQMVVVAHSPEEEETLKLTLDLIQKNNSSKMISTRKSEEAPDVNKKSLAIQYKAPKR